MCVMSYPKQPVGYEAVGSNDQVSLIFSDDDKRRGRGSGDDAEDEEEGIILGWYHATIDGEQIKYV